MSEPCCAQPRLWWTVEIAARNLHDWKWTRRNALLLSTKPSPKHLPGTGVGRRVGGIGIPECSVAIIGGALNPREALTFRRRTESVEPTGRCQAGDNEDDDKDEDSE